MSASKTDIVSATSKKRTSSRLLTPTTQAIPLLQTSAARTFNHAYAPVLLLFYTLQFRGLVATPLDTMIWDLAPLALIQCGFCATCLPPAGTWGSGGGAIIAGTATPKWTKSGSSSSGGSLRRKPPALSKTGVGGASSTTPAAAVSWKSKIMNTILSLLLTLVLPPLPLTVLALVLGAPLSPSALIPHTLLLGLHVSLLAVLPIFYTHGVSAPAWRDIIAAWLPFDEAGVWGGAVGCLVGGWVGAVPMALDWDRDWQAWPVPVLTGVYLGWAIGRLLTASLRLGIGRRIDMSEDEGEKDDEAALAADTKKKT